MRKRPPKPEGIVSVPRATLKKKRAPPPSPTPKQPKPWDSPPYPEVGDETDKITFAAVGEALSTWEHFETSMAHLFAKFLGITGNQLPATRAYGSVLTFRGRAEMVKAAAEAYFFATPDEDLQKDVTAVLTAANSFSHRRNEIAHGVVRCISMHDKYISNPAGGTSQTLKTWGWAVVPSDYSTQKTELIPPKNALAGAGKRPKYTYTSNEIAIFIQGFRGLAEDTQAIAHRVLIHSLPRRP